MQAKIGNPEIEAKVVKILKGTNKLVTVEHVAKAIETSWLTTRAVLLRMAVDGVVNIVKTTSGGTFFTLAENT